MNSRIWYHGEKPLRTTVAGLLLLSLGWSGQILPVAVKAQAEVAVPDQDAKAKALASFPDFVRWPGQEPGVTIGILGEDSIGDSLEKLHATVKRSRRVEDLKDCRVIFIAKSEQPQIGAIIDSLGEASVLTVGETEGFAKDGGIIGFTVVGDKVRFEINTSAARRAGLKIDSRLMRLAVRIFSS